MMELDGRKCPRTDEVTLSIAEFCKSVNDLADLAGSFSEATVRAGGDKSLSVRKV
jgi:hypothetical protein